MSEIRGVRGNIKGGVLTSRLAFVREKRGEVGLERLLAKLPEADRAVLAGVVLPFKWYPFALYSRLDEVIAEELGMGDKLFVLLGSRSANDNLSTDHKRLVSEKDPHGLLKHAASIYRLYYDTGHRTYTRLGDRSAAIRTFDSETFSRADCLTIVGWHQRAIEMCGGKAVRVSEPQCRTRGAALCEYVCEWD
jgi:uncharacterized protein (TIGR02265 family)